MSANIIVTTLLWSYVYEFENGVAYGSYDVLVASDHKYVTSVDNFMFIESNWSPKF